MYFNGSKATKYINQDDTGYLSQTWTAIRIRDELRARKNIINACLQGCVTNINVDCSDTSERTKVDQQQSLNHPQIRNNYHLLSRLPYIRTISVLIITRDKQQGGRLLALSYL